MAPKGLECLMAVLKFFIVSLFILYSSIGTTKTSPSKKTQLPVQLMQIYHSHYVTFFCQQSFSAPGEINVKGCPKCPALPQPIQWMPLVPRQQFAADLNCYKMKSCFNKKGEYFKGLSCCQKQDSTYQQMNSDLHNLVPESRYLAQLRARYKLGYVKETFKKKSSCELYLDPKNKIMEPPVAVRGMIARAYLYMKETYRIPLSREEYDLYLKWHQEYPVTAWERERNQKIKDLQGNENRFVR